MDPEIGEIERGSVLIEDGVITAVGADLDGVDAERIDADGGVVMPGLRRIPIGTPGRRRCGRSAPIGPSTTTSSG